ncbi:MAG: hypothetical protein FJY34_00485 [Betaproteobacteria bacterium]|nr:hypothetical protein [Betaproteobacteria bacterium]
MPSPNRRASSPDGRCRWRRSTRRPGFVLPPLPALHEPETVIVPAGWFRPGRIIELYDRNSRQIRLLLQIDRGSDFERCAFE